MHLYQALAQRVDAWRSTKYRSPDFPVIAEILEWASNPDGTGFRLRAPQFRALETYWYLRLIEKTPHIYNLYSKSFPKLSELLDALGVPRAAFEAVEYNLDALIQRTKTDDDFAHSHKLESLRETLTLDYPSYILALAMGAGKTALIGTIYATEFAMAFEYPTGPFVQNALVFAPGKTIIESLRQLAAEPYDRILPPRLFKIFAASVKLTFTRDGEKDIPVIRKSLFNVVVTNTEKIRIQKENVRKSDLGPLFAPGKEEEAKAEVANLRLQAIASLPHLAVFSDEAHHTYGQSLDAELKKVRKTVDYLAANTNVVCVVNTTGTPYFQRQPLRDVVIWYGLSEGIHDHILKEVADNIKSYDFDENIQGYVAHVVEDFFKDYGNVALPDGTPARLAIYFPQTDDATALRPVVDATLVKLGLSPTLVLEHHTKNDNKADFDRFKLKESPHRVALLVDRGVEGWDVPGLFACALARKLKSSNNFVLQAASRCLRQVPGNNVSARIYLSSDNRATLDRELRENYGESLQDLFRAASKSGHTKIVLRKLDIPLLMVKQIVRSIAPRETDQRPLLLTRPAIDATNIIEMAALTVVEQATVPAVLQQIGDTVEIRTAPRTIDLYGAAVELAAQYRLDLWEIYDELRRIYPAVSEIPVQHLSDLARQIEAQRCNYEVKEETVERGLALVKLEGFEKQVDATGSEVYTAEISYPIEREHLLLSWDKWKQLAGEFAFHYTPYNFDSDPEASFFDSVLRELQLHPDQVEDMYFTGAITSPNQTDFYVEYKDADEAWHRYTPDFIIRRKDGKCLIVEIKDARFKAATNEDMDRDGRGEAALTAEGRKALALKKWERLDPDRLKYQLIFAKGPAVEHDKLTTTREFIEEK